jgi:hypothetical protein
MPRHTASVTRANTVQVIPANLLELFPGISDYTWFICAGTGIVIRIKGPFVIEEGGNLNIPEGTEIRYGDGTVRMGPRTNIGIGTLVDFERSVSLKFVEVTIDSDVPAVRNEGLGRSSDLNTRENRGLCLVFQQVPDYPVRAMQVGTLTHFNVASESFYASDLPPIDGTVSARLQVHGCFPNARFRVGFELETQLVNGYTMDSEDCGGDSEVNETRKEEWIREEMSEMLGRQVNYSEEIKEACGLEDTPELVVQRANLRIANFIICQTTERQVEIMEAIRTLVEEDAERRADNGDFSETMYAEQYFRNLFRGIRVTVHPDGSVDGPEITTRDGGCTTTEFRQIYNTLRNAADFQVDAGCSFHIHMSVEGHSHGYDANLQRLMLKFLMDRVHMWPREAIHRCAFVWGNEENTYFKPEISTEKHNAVAFRSRGTWEFRLWGGILDPKSANRAMHLTIAAYNWARKMVSEGKESEMLGGWQDSYNSHKCTILVCTEATRLGLDWSEKEFCTCEPRTLQRKLAEVVEG